MKSMTGILVFIIILYIKMIGSRNQSYSLTYRIYNRTVPVRIEFDQNRQVEYVMNLHSDGDGKSVTFYDFKQYIVIYKELTARECYITRLTDESLEKEMMQLETKKNSIVDSSVEVTLFSSSVPLSLVQVQSVAGSRAAKFCRGMSSYVITGSQRRSQRKKRLSGPYIQRSYGHFGQQTINYSHYGHETYTLGNFDDKTSQVLRNGVLNNTKADSLPYPIFILLPLSDKFGVKSTHSGGYQLHLPTGQVKASFSGGVNGRENQINHPKKDNAQEHSWKPLQHITNSTDGPVMIIIPGMPPLNVANGRVIPAQLLASKHNDQAKTSAHISTTLDNNNKVLGSSEVENHKIFNTGGNRGQGSFNAQSEYTSNHSTLSSKINGGPRGANASVSASIPGKGSTASNAITQTLAGKSYADSNVDFLHGKISTRAEGDRQNSDAKSRATGDVSSTNTQADIAASKNDIRSLMVNASSDHKGRSGKAESSFRNAYSSSVSESTAFGRYASKRQQPQKRVVQKEPSLANGKKNNPATPVYSTRIISPGNQQTRGVSSRKTFGLRHRSLANSYSKFPKPSRERPTYPTVLVENIAYPGNIFLFPESKKQTKKPSTKTSPKYLFRNKTSVEKKHKSEKDVAVHRSKNTNRSYYSATLNKLQPSKQGVVSNQTINKNRLRFRPPSDNIIAYTKRSGGRYRLDRYHPVLFPSSVSGAHQTQFRKERLRYNVKNSVVPKIPRKSCCSQRHLQTRKKSQTRSAGHGCCGRMTYSKISDRSNLANEKNCKPICYFVYRTIERIKICRNSDLTVC